MFKSLITAVALTFLLNSAVAATNAASVTMPKSPRRAIVYSLISTSVPLVVGSVMMNGEKSAPLGTGIASVGLILGPGVGHVYAGKTRRFWTGAATRGMILSSSIAVAAILIHDSPGDTWEESLPKAILAFGIDGAGVTICTVSAVIDIAAADNSVDDYNLKHGFKTMTLKPAYIAHSKAPGFVLILTF